MWWKRLTDDIRESFQKFQRYLGEREDPVQEGFNFDLRNEDAEPNSTYVLDENVVLSMVEHIDFRTRENNGGFYTNEYSETWRDVIEFLEECYRREDVDQILYPHDTVDRGHIDNGETGSVVGNMMENAFTPIQLGKVDRTMDTDLEPRDDRILNAAYQEDATLITYDEDFLEQSRVDVNTPLGEYLSMIDYE